MLSKSSFEKIEKNKKRFLLFNIIVILFNTGISFTFVIPNLKGFDLATLFIALVFYILVGNIFAGIFINKVGLVFIISLVLCSLGMGWRLWLEWGEFSLVEHTNVVVIIGYPCIISFIITLIYISTQKFKTKKIIFVNRD
ncbi:ABC transporter permease [Solibacillus sp. FSL W8-0474]|uniref:ABC transporter permease n=1 Tax=Solibacillus sp. FSL W8-0474 TaxID=2975336 RepID=UPI0030F89A81